MKHQHSLKRNFLCKVKHIAEEEARTYHKFAEWERRRKEAEDRGEEFTEPHQQNRRRIQKNNRFHRVSPLEIVNHICACVSIGISPTILRRFLI